MTIKIIFENGIDIYHEKVERMEHDKNLKTLDLHRIGCKYTDNYEGVEKVEVKLYN